MSSPNRLELKIPPDYVFLTVAVLMWAAARLTRPVIDAAFALRIAIGVILLISGLAIVQAAGYAFRRASTSTDPRRPNTASALVTGGIYHYTRNPMYLGMTVVLVGWAFFLVNLLSLALACVFVIYINRFQIQPEERILTARFGEEYLSYKKEVGRWL
jgi:protein-S-isoprenylcysteine O-methyltransferase Ste14